MIKNHSIINIIESENKLFKCLWFLTYILAWSLCVFFIFKNLQTYFKYETVTKVDTQKELKTFFPAITFCNLNPFENIDLSKIDQKEITDLNDFYVNKTIKSEKYFTENKLNIQTKLSILSSNNYNKFKIEPQKYYENTIISCTFNSVKCDTKKFTIKYNEFNGKGICLTFNDDGKLQTSISGYYSGLKIEMYLGFKKSILNMFENSGVYLSVHEPQKFLPFSESITLSSGFLTSIGINRINEIKLGKPYNKCKILKTIKDHDSYLYKNTFQDNNQYRQK
jgi:hypothetical protein